MAVTRLDTINNIVNRAAVGVGFDPVADVLSNNNNAFKQLSYLLTDCLQELMEMYPWEILNRAYSYTTVGNEAGILSLPTDFAYMIPQTGWERSKSVPLAGPLSPQEWTYLLGRNLVGSTIYASFRLDQDSINILPNDPTPAGLKINFEYISRNLIEIATATGTYTDTAVGASSSDIVQLPPNLTVAMLKLRFLDAKGFDTTSAERSFNQIYTSLAGKNHSSRILNVAGRSNRFPYLNNVWNLPDTNYGS